MAWGIGGARGRRRCLEEGEHSDGLWGVGRELHHSEGRDKAGPRGMRSDRRGEVQGFTLKLHFKDSAWIEELEREV